MHRIGLPGDQSSTGHARGTAVLASGGADSRSRHDVHPLLRRRARSPRQRPAGRRAAGPHQPGGGGRRLLRRGDALRARGPHRLRPPVRAPDVPGLGEASGRPSTSPTCRAPAASSTARRTSTTPTTTRCCRPARPSSPCSSRPTACAARLTQENLENQVAVVQNEIRVNVQNRPYGGFPWLRLPPVLFDTFANAHDGLRLVRRPRGRHPRRRAVVLRPLLRAGQRGAGGVRRRRPGTGHDLGGAALRRHPGPHGEAAAGVQ